MLAMEIHLIPDLTVLAQLVIFLAALVVLYFFVFKPALRCIDKRNEFTKDAKAHAERLNADSAKIDNEREKSISEALNESNLNSIQALSLRRKEAEKILANARTGAKAIIDSTETSVEISEERVAREMDKQADLLSNEIVTRIMG